MQCKRRQIVYAASLLILAACATPPADKPEHGKVADLPAPPVASSSPQPAPPAQSQPNVQRVPRYGTGVFIAEPNAAPGSAAAPSTGTSGGQEFQFRDAPIDLVLNQVLGETFGLSYAIEPGVQARLTVRLEGITDAASAVSALDGALRLQGLRIVSNGPGFLVSRIPTGGGGTGDFQILVSPADHATGDAAVLFLRNANPEEVARLAKPLLPADVVKLTDPASGMIVLQGAPRDVAAAVDALRAFDVDWFAATSSVFVEVRSAAPEEVKRELDQLLARTGGVEVVAFPRLGALMIFARNRELLDRAQSILADLDRASQSAIQNDTLIYEAKYVSARRLQAVAGTLFGGSLSGPPIDTGPDLGRSGPPVAAQPQIVSGGDVSVAVDEASNLVVVQGSQEDLARINELFARIDRPQKQVLIEATIVEVTLRDEFRFGVQWDGITDFLDVTFTDNSSGAVASKFPGLSIVYNNTDITSVLNALASKTDVQVVSSPRVLALNNQPARIQVGDQVPIVTQSAVSVTDPDAPIVNSTTYRDTGIILEVTPHIRAGDFVEIEVSQEVSDVSETVTSGIDSPTISTRRLEGVLAVPNGATVALGGLVSSNRSKSNTGVPLIKDVPIVGALFSSQADIVRRTELVVLLRPVVLNSEAPQLDISSRLRNALERVRPSWIVQ